MFLSVCYFVCLLTFLSFSVTFIQLAYSLPSFFLPFFLSPRILSLPSSLLLCLLYPSRIFDLTTFPKDLNRPEGMITIPNSAGMASWPKRVSRDLAKKTRVMLLRKENGSQNLGSGCLEKINNLLFFSNTRFVQVDPGFDWDL